MKNHRVDKFAKNPKKALFNLAAPMILAMFVQITYNIVDTAFVGRLGAEAIAALAFSFPVFFIMMAINAGVGTGMGSLIARSLGAKKVKDAENAAMHGIMISLVIALFIFIVGTLTLNPLIRLFGAADDVLPLAVDYLSIIFFGVFFMVTNFTLNHIFVSQGDTKTPMQIQITSLLINIVLDPILIFGANLGVKGAAYATVSSFFIGTMLYIMRIKKRSQLTLSLKSFTPSLRIFKQIFFVGAPASVMIVLMAIYMIYINKLMSVFGTNYVAAIGIITRLESVAIMPVVAFSISSLTLIGMFYGSKRYDLVKYIANYALKSAVIFTSLVGLVMFVFPKLFLRIFTPDYSIINLAIPFLRIDVFTFPLMAVTMLTARIMQGMGFGMPGLIINFARIVFVAMPLGIIFVFVLGYSYLSVAYAMIAGGVVANTIAFIWLGSKFSKLKDLDK